MNDMGSAVTTQLPTTSKLLTSSKIRPDHLKLGAALYIRQSTGAQLREHQESTARQYALKDRLVSLGWASDQIIVIDEDLGVSGNGSAKRNGFSRLLKLITDQQVGIVIGLEMSRLARNSKDWSDLFEVCAIFHALIADEDGVFDPVEPNDRLVLGLKGIIAEMELHTMKVRLERGRMNKAARGELFHQVPVGYVLDSRGCPILDPDESARHAIKMFFNLFEQLGSSNGLFQYLSQHDIRLPFREDCRDPSGAIAWRLPSKTTVYEILKHPLYAGAFGYGRRKKYGIKLKQNSVKKHLPPEQWKVLIKDIHPAYITWEIYEDIQQRLHSNDTVGEGRAAPREGTALLAGIVKCAHCDRKLASSYPGNGHPVYRCGRHRTMAGATPCYSTIRCATLDEFVESKILEVLSPAGVELSFQVIEDEVARRVQFDTLYEQRVAQARYAAEDSERRYRHVDPANRLVASQLERHWEDSLTELNAANDQLQQFRNSSPTQVNEDERSKLRNACADIQQLWKTKATLIERKKSLVNRALTLMLSGKSAPQVACILEREGYRCPRHLKPLSASMIKKMLASNPIAHKQLTAPELSANQWLASSLASTLGIPEKRLKDWVTRGWATAIQRPHGRAWVLYADQQEIDRLLALVRCQTGQGRPLPPKALRTPRLISRDNQ